MNTPPLLPADKYLAGLLGLTDDELRWFKSEAAKRSKIEPGTPTAGAETLAFISLVFTLLSVGLTIVASFFKPKERQVGQINNTARAGDTISTNQKFAPRFGFDSLQRPAVIGTTIPVVYSLAEELPASVSPPRPQGKYGGVRVNLELIWSQMLSLGGDQFLRAMFMVGEGDIASVEGFALGDNPIKSYQYGTNISAQEVGKLTIYYRGNGGRITTNDYLLGRLPASDPGNAARLGGQDVYAILSTNAAYRQDFCFTYKPTNSTTFGLYKWFPNGAPYRPNATYGPTGQIDRQSRNDGNQVYINWVDDFVGLANMWKFKYQWSRRSGIISPSGTYEVDSTFKYRLFSSSEEDTRIIVDERNAREPEAKPPTAKVKCTDIASAVASQQDSADENLIEGELYKFGSALAILIARRGVNGTEYIPNDVFVSSASITGSSGRTMEYEFRVVRRGYIGQPAYIEPTYPPGDIRPKHWKYHNGESLTDYDSPNTWPVISQQTQGFRVAIATITIPRASRAFEIGFRSTVGIKINGFCNHNDIKTYNEINDAVGGKFFERTFDSDKSLGIQTITSGTITCSEERYSFFKVFVRKNDPASTFTLIPAAFAIRSNTASPIYNYLRFFMADAENWELQIEPLSSWEIRNNGDSDRPINSPLIVIDYKLNNRNNQTFNVLGGIRVEWTGTTVSNNADSFRLTSIESTTDKGLGFTDGTSMLDMWAKVAEAFCYDEVQTTVSESPEHEVVYVNVITENQVAPNYSNLAVLGLNVRASNEWTQLSQLSAYVPSGRKVRKLLEGDSIGPSHLFPDIFRDMLLSDVFGMGGVLTEAQLDLPSFVEAAQWCKDRRYFYDGVVADKTNLRQWAADTAASMLLELLQVDGKFALKPAVIFPGSGAVPIRGIFTAGNIVENSFSMEFLAQEDRQPIQASVKWREERARVDYVSSGLFPIEREVLVREASASDSDPIESFDLTAYCTNLEHAIDFACYLIRVRRLITHSIKFSTTPDGIDAGLRAGDYIKVALDYTYYDEFANGVVLDDGTLVTTRPDLLTPGLHDAVYWDGSENPVVDSTLTVYSNGTASPTGIVFIKKGVNSEIRVYRIESISLGENGVIDIEAVHYPVNSNGYAQIGVNWTTYTTDSNWVIRFT